MSISKAAPSGYATESIPEACFVGNASAIPFEILHETGISPMIEIQMESLYENIFSTFARFRAYGNKDGIFALAVRKNQQCLFIFAYRRTKNKIVVLNEQIPLHEWGIEKFAESMFSRFPEVASIYFKAIKTDLKKLAYPYQAHHFTNDIVLSLPESEESYLACLGKSTRENIKRYLKILKRDFPNSSYCVCAGDADSRDCFQKIINFNRARMAEKDKVSGIDDLEAERLWQLLAAYGFIVALVIDGEVRAGTICYRVGSNYFMRVIAHDSDFNKYRLGLLVCYQTICECIRRGGKEFHFLWGREEYKFKLLGKERHFDSITIYRSRWAFLLDAPGMLASILMKNVRDAKIWALDPANKHKAIPQYALRLRALFRAMRRQAR